LANYADVINRVVAVVVDTIILWAIMLVLSVPLGLSGMAFSMVDVQAAAQMMSMLAMSAVYIILGAALWIIYFTYFEGTTGQTLGKKLANIKVVTEKGKQPDYTEAFIRTVLRFVDGILLYLIGLIVILSSEKKQRIGDMAARTIVVKA